jgi:hypothetical protein
MLVRKLSPVSSLILTGLLTSSVLVAPAFSADVKPVSGWAITKIDGADSNAGPYCTLSRQYDNGAIVTLGRNTTEEYSLAVDFRKERFDTDRAYKLSLQPGPGQVRAFEMMPVSPAAMVVRLGWDETFFSALEKSKNLTVGISGEEYAFAMPDIQSGQSDLTACMKGLKTASAAQVADIAPAAGGTDVLAAEPVQTGEGFTARKVAAMDEPKTAAPSKVTAAPAPVSAPAMPVSAAPKVAAAAASGAGQNAIASALESEKRKSAQQLSELQVSKNKISELNEKIRLLESGKGVPADMNAGKVDTLEKQVAKLQSDLAAAKAEAQKAATVAAVPATPAPDPAILAQVKALTDDNAALKTKLAAQEKAAASAAAQKQATPAEKQKDEALTKEMETLRQKLAAAEQDKQSKQVALDAAQKTIAAKEAEIIKAKVPAPAATDTAELAKLKKDAADLAQQRTALMQDLTARQTALEAAQRALAEKETAMNTLKAEKTPKVDPRELTEAKQNLADALSQKAALEQSVGALKAEAEKLRLELNNRQAESGTRADQTASLKLQIEKLKNQLSLKESEARTYRNQLAAVQQQPITSVAAVTAESLNATAPAAGVSAPAPVPAAQPVKKQLVAATAGYQAKLSGTLQNAGIVLNGGVQRTGVAGGQEVYRWKTANLHGRAELTPLAGGAGDFNAQISRHVEAARARCPGDFAAVPTEQQGGKSLYEVACVTPSGNTSASILFYEDQGRFVAVSHETAAEDMDIAMDARDRFAAKVR